MANARFLVNGLAGLKGVQCALGVVFNNAWWSIEELVIDRVGLWKYMPYYRVAKGCVWDLAVALITVFLIWRTSRPGKNQTT